MTKLKIWAGRIITAVALYFVFRFIVSHWSGVDFSLNSTSILFGACAVFFALLFFALRSYGWHTLIMTRTHSGLFIDHAWYLAKSELLRYIPGNLWGLSARVVYAPHFGLSKSEGLILLLYETILLVSSAGILSGLSMLFLPDLSITYRILGVVVLASSVGVFALPKIFFHLKKKVSLFDQALSQTTLMPTRDIVKRLSIYFVLWISFGLFHYFAFLAFFTNGPFLYILSFSVIAWLAGYASLITPSGLGIRELVFGVGLSSAIATGIAHTFAIVTRLIHVLVELIWYGLIALLFYTKKT